MTFYDKYPYDSNHELNLDWILAQIKKLYVEVGDLREIVTDIEGQVDAKTVEILNTWLSDGTLASIIDQELLNHKTYMFPTFLTIDGTSLQLGDVVNTSGYAAVNDGGSGCYIVSNSGLSQDGKSFYPVFTESFKSFGLVGNGIVDDSDALQQYINLKNDVDLGSGIFPISQTITMKENLNLHGDRATINLNDTMTSNGLASNGLNNITIRGIIFDGGAPSVVHRIVSIENAQNIEICDCEFRYGYGYALRVNNTDGLKFNNNYCHNIDGINGNPGGGLYSQGLTNAEIIGNKGDLLRDHLIYIDGSVESYNITVKDTFCSNLLGEALTAAAAIVFYGDCHDFSILNTTVYNMYSGVNCADRNGTSPYNFIIDGVYGMTQLNVVGIHDADTSVSPYRNINAIVTNVIAESQIQDGVSCRYVAGVSISNIVLKNIGRYGIALDYVENCSVNNITATGNVKEVIGWGIRGEVINCVVRNVVALGTGTDVLHLTSRCVNVLAENVSCSGTYTRMVQSTSASTRIHNANIVTGVYERSVFASNVIPSSLTNFLNLSQVGDICKDTTGATNGWKCTAAGNPGTWVSA